MSDELQLSIEKLVYGGDGLSHADGNTVFVPYVMPGEAVRASVKTKRNKLIWGKLDQVITADPRRQKAAAFNGTVRSKSIPPNHSVIATARSGLFATPNQWRWDIFCPKAR